MVDKDELVVAGKSVLELGAGAGLPSLICALVGTAVVDEAFVLEGLSLTGRSRQQQQQQQQ